MELRTPRSALVHRSPRPVSLGALMGLCLVAMGCGSGGGTDSPPPVLPDVSEVGVGNTTCPTGGVRVRIGADDNRDGDLDSDEVDSTSYICNGDNMREGSDDVLVRTVELLVGDDDCPSGGRRVDFGVDNGDGTGLPGNDILENDEVDTSLLDCDGALTVVVVPPTGAAGTFVLDTHGGDSETGNGGNGGGVEEQASRETQNSYLMIANTGSVDASCTVPTLSIDLGSVPAVFTASTTVNVVASMDEAALADGTFFLRANDNGLYEWDTTNGVAQRVTGLRIAEGATVTLAANGYNGPTFVTLSFTHDVDVAGALTTASAGGSKGSLDVTARQIHFAATSSISTAGSEFDQSGHVGLNAMQDLVALGHIDTTGQSGTFGQPGRDVFLEADGALYVGGTITTVGGAASAGGGGNGGDVNLEAGTRQICNAADITTDGGDAVGVAGVGGSIQFAEDSTYGTAVEVRNSGDLRTRGGNETGACSGTCSGGQGGSIVFIGIGGGAISSSGSLDTRGGSSENGTSGGGGGIEVRSDQFGDASDRVVLYQLSGDITTFGGAGQLAGAGGGYVRSYNRGGVGSATRLLGYASAILDGGDGELNGGEGGSISFEPDMDWTEGGHGLYVYTNVSSTGGNSATLNAGNGGSIEFRPELNEVELGLAAVENVIIEGTIDLSGGDGVAGGNGGGIFASDSCRPAISATGIRVGGTITLDGGDGTDGGGGGAGRLFLITARGAVTVSGTIHTVGGASTMSSGGYFAGSSFFGVPAAVSADITAGGGSGGTTGGVGDDIAILSVGSASTVTGTIALSGGAGPTAAMDGRTGLVRVDTGSACVGP